MRAWLMRFYWTHQDACERVVVSLVLGLGIAAIGGAALWLIAIFASFL